MAPISAFWSLPKIVWLKTSKNPDGTDKLDINNPDPCKRARRKIGLDIVWGFRYEGDYQWGGGKIYDPMTGETYSSRIKLEGDTLKVRGYVGVPFLGRTTVCTRKAPDHHSEEEFIGTILIPTEAH